MDKAAALDKAVALDKGEPLDKGTPFDYGTIRVQLLPGLTWDQKASIVRMSVDNQLVTNNRTHYNQILNKCLGYAQIVEDESITLKLKSIGGECPYVYEFQLVLLES